MRKMETQRRQEGVCGEIRRAGGDANRQFAMRQAGNRREARLERKTGQTPPAQVEKNAAVTLAFVAAVVLLIATAVARLAAFIAAWAWLMVVVRPDRAQRPAFFRTGVRMMPAAAEHCVQRQEDGHQR
jgi:hypothetical protein